MNYFQYFQDGGSFQSFLITLPQNLQYTRDYDMERYWELNGKPANFEEGIKKGMFHQQEDGYHANSVMWNPQRGVYEWMKRKDHPTAWMENMATELSGFQRDWRVQNDPERENYLMYTRRK